MFTLNGKYGQAKVFTDLCEVEAQSQIVNLLNQRISEGTKIRIMPDVHAGAGCTIGTTMTLRDKVIPNLVGVDIGCGMEVIKIAEKLNTGDLEKLDNVIHNNIPSGCNIRGNAYMPNLETKLKELYCADIIDIERANKSIGTLGGGNQL